MFKAAHQQPLDTPADFFDILEALSSGMPSK
jgi:hypothetical protein